MFESNNHPDLKHVIAPERNSGVNGELPEPQRGLEAKRSKRGLAITVGSIAGLAVAAGAVFGISALAQDKPSSQPTAEAPADPTAEPTPTSPEKNEALPSELDLEIPADLSADELGTTFVDRYNAWLNAGSNNQQVIDDWLAATDMSTGDYVTGLATEYASEFTDALFIEGWDTPGAHDDLVSFRDRVLGGNAHYLELNLKTSDPAYGDIEPFRDTDRLVATRETSSTDSARVLEVDLTQTNNADKNRVGEDFGLDDAVITVPNYTLIVTFVTVDGHERISAIDARSR